MAKSFGNNLARQATGKQQGIRKDSFVGAYRNAKGLGTKQLEKRTANLYTKFKAGGFDPKLRSRLIGFRRALSQQELGKGYQNMSRQDRHAALAKKLGADYSKLYYQKPTKKPPFMPPNRTLP